MTTAQNTSSSPFDIVLAVTSWMISSFSSQRPCLAFDRRFDNSGFLMFGILEEDFCEETSIGGDVGVWEK
ncbi:hypothetical protein N7465_006471 [Penicillium sp. CMV-2018d]|nr:hypothetical protein N7465_006471 [Penicillium sp. CMV-2018d]